uniref:RNase H type-1 domain-containing protein n=1 Tax=Fagus sylvatica TaxID=28930 RepID=A0A2N9ESE7_FAGSY
MFTKLNIDAALSSDKATIAVIARDHNGTIIKAWAKHNDILDPTVAEANAIRWVQELTSSFGFEKVIVESDAKNCIDDLYGHPDSSNWRISAVSS